ncbi:hypothetical protein Taro_013380 [Colocasia esculenta]|uniref:Pentatricopeptide repeat-containing protein n=1 Tax=Colocasia esculenta TaxID=4460 RepID=A0A843UFE4_COLES|nr:hypothetical protein [Colocasia esculenta]
MYARCGASKAARAIFDEMLLKGIEDVVFWNSMLACHAQNGELALALTTFARTCKQCLRGMPRGMRRGRGGGGGAHHSRPCSRGGRTEEGFLISAREAGLQHHDEGGAGIALLLHTGVVVVELNGQLPTVHIWMLS